MVVTNVGDLVKYQRERESNTVTVCVGVFNLSIRQRIN